MYWMHHARFDPPLCVISQLLLDGVTTGRVLHVARFVPPSVAI